MIEVQEQQSGIIQRVSGGLDNVADYLPDQLVEIGSDLLKKV